MTSGVTSTGLPVDSVTGVGPRQSAERRPATTGRARVVGHKAGKPEPGCPQKLFTLMEKSWSPDVLLDELISLRCSLLL